MMILAFILAGLTFARVVQSWQIIVLAFLLGCANAFDAPARQAFVTELIDQQDLTNAIALNSSMFNAATVVGPAIAGITYAVFGPAWCFTINGITFIAVIIALLMMKLAPYQPAVRALSIFVEIKDGLSFAAKEPTIRIIILNLAVISLAGLGFVTLLPVWAVDVLGGDATTNGYLHTARGIGALSGALVIILIHSNSSHLVDRLDWHRMGFYGDHQPKQYPNSIKSEQRAARSSDGYFHINFLWIDANRISR
jgi:MFS family permease